MALSVANHVGVQGTSAGTSITSPSFASTNGNLVVASVHTSSSVTVDSVIDSPTNGYSNTTATAASAAGNRVSQFYAANITGSGTHTVTANFASAFANIFVVEVGGAATSSVLDQKTARAQTAQTDFTTADVTTTTSDQILIGSFAHDGGTVTITSPNGFTLQEKAEDSAFIPGAHATKIVATTVTDHAAFSVTGGAINGSIILGTYSATALPTSSALTPIAPSILI